MPAAKRGVLEDVTDQLNASIRTVSSALESGSAEGDLLERARRQAEEGLSRLRDLALSEGPRQAEARAAMQHLDIFVSLIDSVDKAPELSRKLAAHILEEQTKEPATAGGTDARVTQQSGPTGSMPGGRRPLTVGSLIGR